LGFVKCEKFSFLNVAFLFHKTAKHHLFLPLYFKTFSQNRCIIVAICAQVPLQIALGTTAIVTAALELFNVVTVQEGDHLSTGAGSIRAELVVAVDSERCEPPRLTLNGIEAKGVPRPVVPDSIVKKPVLIKSVWSWEFPVQAVKTGENVVSFASGSNATVVWCEIQMKTGAGDALEQLMPVPQSIRSFGGTVESPGWKSVKHVQGWVEGAPRATGVEAYCLDISTDGVTVTASSQAGLRHARTTFEQLEKLSGGRLPCSRITDYPAFRWRGFMHDSGRNFLEVEHVKRLIDVMARAKMNLFHWHLTEYYAWRLESKKYPELQKDSAFYLRYIGKYYTQEQFKDVVNYAYERGITVVPEFDVPGHALAFRRAFGFKTMRDEGVVEKLCDLIDELCSLVPRDRMPFVHLGSDEARYPEELVPKGWMAPLLKRVFANGRTVIGWTPGELAGLENTGPVVGMRWGNQNSTGGTGKIPYLDAARMYIDTLDPFEIPCVATYRRICPWDAEKEGERLGAVVCAWHDDILQHSVIGQCAVIALLFLPACSKGCTADTGLVADAPVFDFPWRNLEAAFRDLLQLQHPQYRLVILQSFLQLFRITDLLLALYDFKVCLLHISPSSSPAVP
jgi:hypothetical protein